MSEHTPGPWTADRWRAPLNGMNGWSIRPHRPEDGGMTGHQVAVIYDDLTIKPMGEPSANARLIAAAPDLLACLKAAAQDFAIMRYGKRMPEWDAAIAKAEGR